MNPSETPSSSAPPETTPPPQQKQQPPPTSSSSEAPSDPKPQFQAQRPPPSRARPYSHFHQHVSTASSGGVQRGGLAIGVPASHHPPRLPPPPQGGGSVPLSAFGAAPSFGGMQPSNLNAQGRPSVQGVAMVGSLGSASHMRPSPTSTQHQLRPGQSPLRSITPGTIATTAAQKLSSQGIARGSSMSAGPQVGSQGSHLPHQHWMSNQTRPIHASLSAQSFRPQARPQNLQQRHVQQQQQSSLSQKPQQHNLLPQQQQKQQQQISLTNQVSLSQQVATKTQQGIPQQQQLQRVTSQKVQTSATVAGQPSINQPGTIVPTVTADDADPGNHILRKRSIHELVSQIDPAEKLDPEVEDILVEIADDFIDSITTVACSLAKHRKSNTLEARDVLLHLERNWNMTLPGFSGDDIKGYKKPTTIDIHKERLAVIRKSMMGSNETGNMKNSNPGQHNSHVKGHSARAL